jgi:hypothetical protein
MSSQNSGYNLRGRDRFHGSCLSSRRRGDGRRDGRNAAVGEIRVKMSIAFPCFKATKAVSPTTNDVGPLSDRREPATASNMKRESKATSGHDQTRLRKPRKQGDGLREQPQKRSVDPHARPLT